MIGITDYQLDQQLLLKLGCQLVFYTRRVSTLLCRNLYCHQLHHFNEWRRIHYPQASHLNWLGKVFAWGFSISLTDALSVQEWKLDFSFHVKGSTFLLGDFCSIRVVDTKPVSEFSGWNSLLILAGSHQLFLAVYFTGGRSFPCFFSTVPISWYFLRTR